MGERFPYLHCAVCIVPRQRLKPDATPRAATLCPVVAAHGGWIKPCAPTAGEALGMTTEATYGRAS